MHGTADTLKSSDTLFTNKPPAEFYDVEKDLSKTSKENIKQKLNLQQKDSNAESDKE